MGVIPPCERACYAHLAVAGVATSPHNRPLRVHEGSLWVLCWPGGDALAPTGPAKPALDLSKGHFPPLLCGDMLGGRFGLFMLGRFKSRHCM